MRPEARLDRRGLRGSDGRRRKGNRRPRSGSRREIFPARRVRASGSHGDAALERTRVRVGRPLAADAGAADLAVAEVLEHRGELERVARSLGGVLRETARDQPAHLLADVGSLLGEVGSLLGLDLLEDLARARALEGRLAAEEGEERRAHGVNIGSGGDARCVVRLLRGHVLRCPERDAGGGELIARLLVQEGAREAEIGELDAVVRRADQDVLGLHVAMDDVRLVRRGEAERGLVDDPQRLVLEERTLGEERLGRRPLDELHDEVEEAVLVAHVLRADEVRVVDLRREPRLANEPLDVARILPDESRRERLHGDGEVEREVMAEVDGAHAALSDPPDEADAAEDAALVGDRDAGHEAILEERGVGGRTTRPRDRRVGVLQLLVAATRRERSILGFHGSQA